MHNKKIIGAAAAIGLSVTLIGGTLAWFTSQDKVSNIFATGGVDNPNGANGNGVEIWEQYNPKINMVPGDTEIKLVQTQNTTTYDSFIRVKITPKWKDNKLNNEMIELTFGDNNSNLGSGDGQWLKGNDGYYYYMGKIDSKKFTNPILSSVKLSTEAGSEYRDAKFDVFVEAESIQADNDAQDDAWKNAGDIVTNRLNDFESTPASGNDKAKEGVTITETETREVGSKK
ncbi:hypothetical protein GCM10008904_19760 [Paraclostridium ghonii]|uniref:Alternate signal-mediated exported protein n=1 Tax=Paraclostridium ghonii TaxID=29358 RepID=A0ABU0MWI4_9FIRM|nr:BsaA family SipW-dependent biofilm matrix protein [Paeniclostridium ghonii]MDQ0555230.1 alternate signal-mediated exported protein [Paeniclostridium ghonii]